MHNICISWNRGINFVHLQLRDLQTHSADHPTRGSVGTLVRKCLDRKTSFVRPLHLLQNFLHRLHVLYYSNNSSKTFLEAILCANDCDLNHHKFTLFMVLLLFIDLGGGRFTVSLACSAYPKRHNCVQHNCANQWHSITHSCVHTFYWEDAFTRIPARSCLWEARHAHNTNSPTRSAQCTWISNVYLTACAFAVTYLEYHTNTRNRPGHQQRQQQRQQQQYRDNTHKNRYSSLNGTRSHGRGEGTRQQKLAHTYSERERER